MVKGKWAKRYYGARAIILINPFEMFLEAYGLMAGIPLILGHTPRTLDQLLPHPWAIGWGLFLFCGSLMGMFGLITKRYRIEIVGLTLLAFASVIYGMALLKFAGSPGLLVMIQTTMFGLACWVRVAFIGQTLDTVKREVAKHAAKP